MKQNGPAAHRAILDVLLHLATPRIDVHVDRFTAMRAELGHVKRMKSLVKLGG
jgi:hypothetical protein